MNFCGKVEKKKLNCEKKERKKISREFGYCIAIATSHAVSVTFFIHFVVVVGRNDLDGQDTDRMSNVNEKSVGYLKIGDGGKHRHEQKKMVKKTSDVHSNSYFHLATLFFCSVIWEAKLS